MHPGIIVCFDSSATAVSLADLEALLDPAACEARWAAGTPIEEVEDPMEDDPQSHCGCGNWPCTCDNA